MVSASQVKELRERSGAGMMDCKKALVEANGDMEKAFELMRKAGQAKADKKATRIAAEGVVIVSLAQDNKLGIIVDVNCETDFVGRDESFLQFANNVAELALNNKVSDISSLAQLAYPGFSGNVEQMRQDLINKIGENIQIRRIQLIKADGLLGSYVHNGRIGVIVAIEGKDIELAKDLAMHIAANNPLVINKEEVSSDLIEKEREIFIAQAASSGKPADIIEKMVEGRIRKYLDEISLMGQAFVKDPNLTVAKLLQQKNAKVTQFVRFEVGEGIEKVTTDFVAEVMAQAKG